MAEAVLLDCIDAGVDGRSIVKIIHYLCPLLCPPMSLDLVTRTIDIYAYKIAHVTTRGAFIGDWKVGVVLCEDGNVSPLSFQNSCDPLNEYVL